MNHGNKVNHLGRTDSHRKALMANLASSLILHKKIKTTVAKAKELRKYVEPLITKAKNDTTHSRRTVFSYLKHKDPVKELFTEVVTRVADRPGGYTRILRTGNRLGDNAEMCIIELVDFNEVYTGGKKAATKTRRRRGGAKKAGAGETAPVEAVATEEAPKATRKKKAAPAEGGEAEATAAPKKKAKKSEAEGDTEAAE
jgi:large subunit ribosomal protein L17